MRDAVLADTGHGLVICHLGMCSADWCIMGDVLDCENDPVIGLFNPMVPSRWRYDVLCIIPTHLSNIIDGFVPELEKWAQEWNAHCKRRPADLGRVLSDG